MDQLIEINILLDKVLSGKIQYLQDAKKAKILLENLIKLEEENNDK